MFVKKKKERKGKKGKKVVFKDVQFTLDVRGVKTAKNRKKGYLNS